LGGAGLFVAVQAWSRSRLGGHIPHSSLLTLAALVVCAAIAVVLPAVLALLLAALVLVGFCLARLGSRAGISPVAP
jgi:hypothetical protein